MLSPSIFVAAAAFLAVAVVARPAPDIGVQSSSTFTVTQVKNPGFKGFVASGPAALAKVYLKYGKPLPADLAAATSAHRSSGSVTAKPQPYDVEYLCPVQIGSPAQTLNLDFDTGSADLWVFSTETPGDEVHGQKLYRPGSSSTAKKMSGLTWSITYGDGSSSSGDVYTDKVSIGGISVAAQAVESAEQVSSEFSSDSALSGLLGLSFDSINQVKPTRQETFFDNAKSSLAAPLFTADLKKGAPGSYDFGYIDSSKYEGSISYVSANTGKGFWEFTGSGYAVGSGSFVDLDIDAVTDTGTTLLLVPESVVSAYYADVSGASYDASVGGWTFACSAKLPSFTFGVGSYRGVIPGSYMNLAPVKDTKCFGGIQSDAEIGFSIYGDILIKAQFVVFDGGNTRIGFAAKQT